MTLSRPGSTEPRRLAGRDSVLLLHALAHGVLASAGVRVISIKGPVSDAQGLRQAHQWADADLLVDPASFEQALFELGRLGWKHRPTSRTVGALASHSETLIHDAWASDLDVHRFFPGLTAPPSVVFDALWDRKVSMPIGGLKVFATDPLASILIQAAHALRTRRQTPRHDRELAYLSLSVLPKLGSSAVAELQGLAGRTGSSVTVLPFIGIEPDAVAQAGGIAALSEAERDWLVRVDSGGTILGQAVAAWPQLTAAERARLMRHALWPRETDLRLDNPALPPGRRAALCARLGRLWRGLRSVPGAVRSASRSRGLRRTRSNQGGAL